VNYNQVVVKCQILQECFLENINMQKFQNMEHSNSRTFKGLEFFFRNSRTSQAPYEPWNEQYLQGVSKAACYAEALS